MAAARPETTGRKPHGQSKTAPANERLVYTVPEAGRLLGLSRNGSYEAAKRGDIPTIRIGRLLLVPKGPFHRMLEPMATGTATPAKEIASKSSKCQDSKDAAAGDRGVQT
jgi:excisionase family DNA binding protein